MIHGTVYSPSYSKCKNNFVFLVHTGTWTNISGLIMCKLSVIECCYTLQYCNIDWRVSGPSSVLTVAQDYLFLYFLSNEGKLRLHQYLKIDDMRDDITR